MQIVPPNLLPIFDEGRYAYQLASDWTINTPRGVFSLPQGLIIDGASVPRIFWNVYPPDGLYRSATTLHDWLYAHQGALKEFPIPFKRKECDDLMLWACREAKAAGSWLMHRMVRMFGGGPWKKSVGPRIEPLRYKIS